MTPEDPLARRLLYRFGFLLHATDDGPPAPRLDSLVAGWSRHDRHGLTLWLHPETSMTERSTDDGCTILIGEAFTHPATTSLDATLDQLQAEDGAIRDDVLDTLCGRFVLIVIGRGRAWVVHDPIGSRSVFYRIGETLGVSSHAELLADAFGHGRAARATAFQEQPEYRQRGVTYLPGDWSVYDGVFGLVPNNAYDLGARRTHRYWPLTTARGDGDFDAFHSAMDAYFGDLVSAVTDRHTPVLGLTGGIDTRAMIAAFRRHGAASQLVTWTGVYMTERELPSVAELADYLHDDHTYLDVKADGTDDAFRSVKAIASRNVGHFRGHAKLTAHMHRLYGESDAVFVRGYGGEVLRGFYNISKAPITDLTVPELFRGFNSGLKVRPPSDEYTRIGLEAFEEYVERAHYDDRSLVGAGFDINDIFYWEHRMGMWGSAMHNEMDAALMSVTGYNSRSLYERAFSLDPERRLSKELLREAIRRSDPGLAAIDVSA